MPLLFPAFRTPPATLGLAVAAAALVGGLAGLVPAIRASRIGVIDGLRRLD
jgi:ABC-type antimicrobial peptide transport system permease subunit